MQTDSQNSGSGNVGLSLSHLQEMDWKHYEILCRDYFQAKGYQARLTALGADGGVDVILSQFNDDGTTTTLYVQCKAWSQQKIGVKAVRELYGVMAADSVSVGIFMTASNFTEDAKHFAEGKRLQLISGIRFIELILQLPHQVQQRLANSALHGDYKTPTCPSCDIKMSFRKSSRGKNAGEQFWGCQNFPRCKQMLHTKKSAQESSWSKDDASLESQTASRFRPEKENIKSWVNNLFGVANAKVQQKLKTVIRAFILRFIVGGLLIFTILIGSISLLGWSISSFKEIILSRTETVQQQSNQQGSAQQIKTLKGKPQAVDKLSNEAQARAEAARQAVIMRRQTEEKQLQQKAKYEKDKAFDTWYQVPWKCEGRVANENMVDCVNRRMRARKEFEQLWSEGKITTE